MLTMPPYIFILHANDAPYFFFPHFPFLPREGRLQFITLVLFLRTQAIIRREGEPARTAKKMLKRLLTKTKSKKKKEAASSAIPTLDRLHEVFHPLCYLIRCLYFLFLIFTLAAIVFPR